VPLIPSGFVLEQVEGRKNEANWLTQVLPENGVKTEIWLAVVVLASLHVLCV